ncbi:hypothetical protein BGW36DRAFT_302783 [Talaromyces proteolyticus]|uniref:Cytochrome b561 domain-containing protein n=1 Tax=Talaromyces proteolyticus TaxID=1131652 RepID=A0AAD4PXD9_9EURO|nr:uncharacterized protein BGW36DRAFT_302783 [Talaromyces proteolyticus]KAH8693031.1 hypothetical protein BGW36DRAFT_302783 [Talaromyces proteolyticus]
MSALFCLVLYWLSPALAEIIQYCHDDPVFCFSVTLQQNETSGHDVYLTITATPSDLGGWTSIGFGTGMKDALMFIIYADQDQESLVTSIRTADGHVMPTLFQGHTHDIEVLHADASESKYYAQFVCHSCDVWSPAKIDANGNTSFIYAGTSKQAFHGADLNSKLTVHEYSGVVIGDLSSAWKLHKDDRIPEIKPNEIIGFNEPSKPSQDESVFSRVRVHGFIMTVAFMGLFFAGSLAIRLPLLRAFKYHWVIQLSASFLALGSAAYMILRSTHFGTHKIIGIIVVSSLVVQAAAGYKHHIDFVKIRRRGLFSLVHRWLGRSIFVLGTLNVGLGMYYRGWSTMGMLGWFVIWSAELVSYAYVQLQHRRRTMKEQRGQPVALRDSDSEVFDIGDDLEDEDDIEGIPLMETDKHGAK